MGHRQPPPLRRRRPIREPKRRFFLYCEGKETEPSYFQALRRCFPNALIEVKAVGGVGVPRTVADAAKAKVKVLDLGRRRKSVNSFEEKDEVWAVFDRDEHPHFDDAIGVCKSGKVRVARSNPCFEVWLILHEQDYDKPENKDGVIAHFGKLRPEYNRHGSKTPDCTDLVIRVEDAERRAEAQLHRREAEGDPFGKPSTTVSELTKAIRAAAEASAAR